MIKAEIDYYLELDHDLCNGYEDGWHSADQDDEVGLGQEQRGIHPETQHLESATRKHVFCFHQLNFILNSR